MQSVPRRFRLSLAIAVLALTATGTCLAQVQKEREFQECPVCPVMVGIPAGTFVMGSPRTENGRFDSEGPLHDVAIKAFALGKYDVTSAEFLTFLKETGYQPPACNSILDMKWSSPGHGRAYAPYSGEPPRWPAVCLDWRDAEKYIAWLNEKVRLAHPALGHAHRVYRLPSEAEWEYAARAGTKTARWWGDASDAIGKTNCNGCGSPVGQSIARRRRKLRPQPVRSLGLLGNAWQWTEDCWHPNYIHAPDDGRAWTKKIATSTSFAGVPGQLPIFVRSAAPAGAASAVQTMTTPPLRASALPGISRELRSERFGQLSQCVAWVQI